MFVGPVEGEELAHSVSVGLGRSWVMRRGSATFNAGGSQPFYQESTSLNDFAYSFGAGLSYSITRRLGWNGSTSFSSGLARDSDVLNDAGLLLPSVTARSSSASSTFSYALNRKSNISWSISEAGVGFPSDLFVSGTSVGSTTSYSRTVGATQSIGVSSSYTRTFSDEDSTVLGFNGSWSATAGKGWSVFASLGVIPYKLPDESGYRVTTGASAGLSKPISPGQTFGITYDRGITQTFGHDRTNHIIDTFAGNYALKLVTNLSASFGGSYTIGASPLAPDRKTIGQAGHAGLSWAVLPRLSVSFSSYVYGRTDQPAERVTSYGTSLSVSYSTTF